MIIHLGSGLGRKGYVIGVEMGVERRPHVNRFSPPPPADSNSRSFEYSG
jgi:hypothetical protein